MKSDDSSLTGSLFALTLTILCCLPAPAQNSGAGTAVSLNGTTNAWLNVPNGTWFSGNFTVEGWVYARSYNSWSRLIDFSDGPNTNNVYLALSDSTTGDPAMGVFTNNDGTPTLVATNTLPLNQWVHLAATGNGTNGTIYLNGVPVGTGVLNIAPNIVRTNNYIGRSAYSADSYANANFDELSIWNVARTRAQIQTGMNHPLVGNESGLVGYWRFDEGSGTNAFDSTGNGNTATLNSGVTWTNSSAPLTNAADYALSFNGAQVVTIPHQAAQDAYPLTVMCWFMEPTNSPGGGALVGNYVSDSLNGWQLAISGQLYAWYYRDGSDYVGNTSAGAVNDGRWHHAAFVVNSTGGVIYLDGVPKLTNAWAGTAGPCTTSEAAFLGIYQGDSFLTANEDEVSIWNVALTQSQIQTYMHQPLQGTESGLINYYRMNEGIGTNIYDYTTNAVTGTFSANPPAWIISGAQIQEPPEVVTLPATVNGASATLSGTLNPQGLNSGSWFRWGMTTAYGNVTAANTFAAGYTISTNTIALSGLAAGMYHFQIVATNSAGTNYGADQTFDIPGMPQVTTLPATVNGTSATLIGTVNPEGGTTASWFNWGLTTSYGNVTTTNTFAAGYTVSTNTIALSGLSAGTYYFQIVASNSSGTSYGTGQSFNIVGPPAAATQPATVNGNSAILSGTVNPAGLNTEALFEWGSTTSYGNFTPENPFAASYTNSTNTSTLNGLTAGTYHFRIVADNSAGTTFGGDQSFTLALPQVTTLPALVSGTYVTLYGTVNPEGEPTTSWFNWGPTTNYSYPPTPMNFFPASFSPFENESALGNLPSGTYHFQIVATNGVGTNYGSDQSFIIPQFQLGNANVLEGPASGEDSVVLGATPTNANWSATANASWLHLVNSSGIGSTNVIFSFDTNSGATRTGTLTIAGQMVTVTQAGSTYVQVGTPITLFSILQADTEGVTVDNQGNVYFASDGAIMKWTPTNNTISTIIPYSSGTFAAQNLTLDSAGNLYIANGSPAQIDKWSAGSLTTLIPGLEAPSGIALDSSGNVYFSDINIPTIDEWVATNDLIINLARIPSTGLAVDAANNVYYDDSSGGIYELNAQNQSITTLINYDFYYEPFGLAVDGGGNLYMVLNNTEPYYEIEKWSAATGVQSTVVPVQPNGPQYTFVAVDSARNIYFGIQEEGNGAQPVPALQELPYAFVDPTAKSEPFNAGSDSLPAVAPSNINLNTPFAPTSDQSWLTITGTAGGVVSYSFTANTSTTPRTANIQLLGQSITINQAGESASVQLGVTNLLEGPISGTDSVIVAGSPATLPWIASPNASWLHLSATNQSGDTNLLFTFDTNTNVTRTGTITIGNQTLTVTQAGSNYVAASQNPITVDTDSVEGPYGMAMDSAGNIYLAMLDAQEIQEWIATNDTIITLVSNGLSDPVSVAVDSADNVYIVNEFNNTIMKWTAADGNLTTLVGSGLNHPQAIALDTAGNVYIADADNNAIKEWLAASSNVVTLVSTGLNYPAGVAVDLAGNVYIADTGNLDLKEWSPASGNVTVLASSGIAAPYNLAVDGSGNVFFGQTEFGNILRWSPDGALGVAAYADSFGVAVDGSGNLFMAQNAGSAIQESPRAFMVPAAKAEPFTGGNDSLPVVVPANILQAPGLYPTTDQPWVAVTGVTNGVTSFSFAPNNSGAARTANIIVLGNDVPVTQNAVVLGTTNLLEGPAAGTDSITLAVSPPILPWTASSDSGWLHPPVGYPTVAVPTNVIFTFDANPGATRTGTLTLGATPLFITQAGVTYVAAPAPLTVLVTNELSAPAGVAVDAYGDVYISDPGDQAIDEWSPYSPLQPIFIANSSPIEPTGVTIGGGTLYYSDTAANAVSYWAYPFGIALMSGLNRPYGVAAGSDFTYVVVADSGNNAVEKYNQGSPGNWVTLVSGLNGPKGVAVDAFGDVYIADTGNNAIKEWFPANGSLVTIVSTGLNQPAGLAVDASGNIFIADTGDSAIKEWTAVNGTLTTLVGSGINQPTGVALDSADDLYIADTGNNMVEELPRAFVDPTAVSEPYSAGSDTWSMILPDTVILVPPFAPTSDQPWLTVADTGGDIVSFSFTANTGMLSPRTAHLNVLGVSVSVTQTNAPVIAPQLTGAQLLSNGQFQFTFTNTPGTTFTVLATTNLTLPLADWVNLGTVSNISPGIYQFNSPLTNSQEFYEIVWP